MLGISSTLQLFCGAGFVLSVWLTPLWFSTARLALQPLFAARVFLSSVSNTDVGIVLTSGKKISKGGVSDGSM